MPPPLSLGLSWLSWTILEMGESVSSLSFFHSFPTLCPPLLLSLQLAVAESLLCAKCWAWSSEGTQSLAWMVLRFIGVATKSGNKWDKARAKDGVYRALPNPEPPGTTERKLVWKHDYRWSDLLWYTAAVIFVSCLRREGPYQYGEYPCKKMEDIGWNPKETATSWERPTTARGKKGFLLRDPGEWICLALKPKKSHL